MGEKQGVLQLEMGGAFLARYDTAAHCFISSQDPPKI